MLHEELLNEILPKEKLKCLKEFIQDYISDPNVVGIILTGSFVHGDPGPRADLDIHIVLKESNNRDRGNIFIDGHEIEYFVNPVNQIERYFEKEFPNDISTAHMFGNSIVLFEKGPDLQRLINIAKHYLRKARPDMTSYDIYFCRYELDDYRKDILDALDENDKFTFELISIQIIRAIIHYFGRYKNFYPGKPKRLLKQLQEIDKTFANILKGYLEYNGTIVERYKLLDECISYIESFYGGSRPDEYNLTADLDL